MSDISIDIAIVNYRCVADTLEALAPLALWPHGKVWVVDNSAYAQDVAHETEQLREACAAMPCVRLLTPSQNIGYGCACSLAFEESQAEFFLLLNPDARIAAPSILTLAQTLVRQPQLGGVSPKIYWNAQRSFLQPAAFPQTPWSHLAQTLATRSRRVAQWVAHRNVRKAMQTMASSAEFRVSFLAGSVLMLRRAAVEGAGGLFDPRYFMFYEDSDLSLRLRKAGYGLIIAPQADAEHTYRHRVFKAELMAQSEHQYFIKFFGWFYLLTNKLQRLSLLRRPVLPADWYRVLPEPIKCVEDFTAQTGAAYVLAFSPTLLMMPSIFRASLQSARPFDSAEWALLEPGNYTALLINRLPAENTPVWVYFCKA